MPPKESTHPFTFLIQKGKVEDVKVTFWAETQHRALALCKKWAAKTYPDYKSIKPLKQ